MNEVLYVLTNLPDAPSARKLGRTLVESRLVACVSLLGGVESVYRWKGNVESASEVLVVIKTVASTYDHVQSLILEHHPYELPEIVAVPVVTGLSPYLQWVVAESSG
ncbi:MAG: divalent-cation tolerance protein CutA [Burkholderiales bacterium]